MFLLDTDICSYVLRQRPASVYHRFQKAGPEALGVSVITVAELRYGLAKNPAAKINTAIVEDFLSRLLVLPWDEAAAAAYGKLRTELEARGTPIGNMNLMIAAHALSIPATLVTNNLRHFMQVPKLKTANWT